MIAAEMMGLVCVLSLGQPENIKPDDGVYCPSELIIRHSRTTHFCLVSWDDRVRRGGAITMQYAGPAPR